MLDDLAIHEAEDSRTVRVATALLRTLGAQVDASGSATGTVHLGAPAGALSARVLGAGAVRMEPGLPPGTLEVACGYALAAAALLAALASRPVSVPAAAIRQLVLASGTRQSDTSGAMVTLGRGAVCADLSAEGEQREFQTMLDTLEDDAREDPEAVAAEAQAWRLPVMPYRVRNAALGPSEPAVRELGRRPARPGESWRGSLLGRPASPLAGVTVCDLTTMWAGPLATGILARLGATVVKVEPSCRLDGMRRGADGYASGGALFERLNRGKVRADLDLRAPKDRKRFERLVRRSDLVVDSFSPRVMPNLGYGLDRVWELRDDALIAGVRAFPEGPWRSWSGYGSGIHAASGLAAAADGSMQPAVVSYPDPLAGLALLTATLAQLHARAHLQIVTATEATLWGAVTPLRE